MRAEFLATLSQEMKGQTSQFSLHVKEHHHLFSVARLKLGEEVLFLNGQGLRVQARLEKMDKVEALFEVLFHEQLSRSAGSVDLALCMPKRQALDDALKVAVEVGFQRIFLVNSERAQAQVPSDERLQNVLASAIKQSNNPWLPQINELQLDQITDTQYDRIFLFDSFGKSSEHTQAPISLSERSLTIIGPEGGLSKNEVEQLLKLKKLTCISLQMPILRTPTCVALSYGLLFARVTESTI